MLPRFLVLVPYRSKVNNSLKHDWLEDLGIAVMESAGWLPPPTKQRKRDSWCILLPPNAISVLSECNNGQESCAICHSNMSGTAANQGVTITCGHQYHPRCILFWMQTTLAAPYMARQAPSCPACMYPLAGIRGAFPELPHIIEATEELKTLSKDIDTAFDRLPWTEKRRALKGQRHEDIMFRVIRTYRFDLDASAIITFGASTAVMTARSFDNKVVAVTELSLFLGVCIVCCIALVDRQKRIVPEVVLCCLKHAALLCVALYTGHIVFQG